VICIDGGYQVQIIGKNDIEYRNAPLKPEAYQAIQTWLKDRPVDSDFVFTSFEGRGEDRLSERAMNTASIWRTVKAYADQCGLEHIKVHDFRRFVGTQLAKKDPHAAQKALGHKDISTTFNHYVLNKLEVGITDDLY
jgi:integrase